MTDPDAEVMEDVLDRGEFMDAIYMLRHHKGNDGVELCDWTCHCNGRLDGLVAHDTALRAKLDDYSEALEAERDLCDRKKAEAERLAQKVEALEAEREELRRALERIIDAYYEEDWPTDYAAVQMEGLAAKALEES